MLDQECKLVDGASKLLLIKTKDLTLCSMLAGGRLILYWNFSLSYTKTLA